MTGNRKQRVLIGLGVTAGALVLLLVGMVIGGGGDSDAVADTVPVQPTSAPVESIAAPAEGCRPGSSESCAVDLGDELVVATSAATTVIDNGDGTATVSGELEIGTESGGIVIDDAELIIEIPPDGGPAEIVGGSGKVPFPAIGFLEQAELIGTSTGLFGTDYGRDLEHLGAFLNPDTRYLWMTFSDGMNVETGFAEMFPDMDTSALPSSFNVPLGVSATMVIDPLDPYIYIGGACPEFKGPDDADGDESTESTTTTTQSSTTTTTTLPEDDADITIGPEEGPGEDCGIGFSLQGNIPFTPSDIDGLPETVSAYSGHIVIHGEVPLGSTGLAIDGVTIQRFDATGYRLDGNGDVAATVPFIKGLIDLEIPMGNAAAGMEVTAYESAAYAVGDFGGSQEPLVLPLPIPIEIPNEQSAEVGIAASIGGSVDANGVYVVDPGSMLEIRGSQGVGASAFAELLDVELEDFQTTTGTLVLNREGARLEASTNFGIHPSVDLGAGTGVTAVIDAESLADSFIEMVGVMSFAAVELEGQSAVRLDRTGLQAHGLLATALGGVELDGTIGVAGIDLRGSAELKFPVNIGDRLADDASSALQGAIDEVEKIDGEIARISEEIRADRRQRSSDFQSAKGAVDDAQAEVARIDGSIKTNRDKINDLKDKIDAICAGKSGLAKTACQAANSVQIGIWAGEIAALETANVGLEAAKAVATGTLGAARLVLEGVEAALDAIPIDTDPRLVALNVSRDTALAVLETTQSLVEVAGNGGSLGGSVDLRLGTSGLGGDARIEWCDASGCTTLAGGELRLAPTFAACISVFGIPDICAEF